MKAKEFIKKAKELGYSAGTFLDGSMVVYYGGDIIVSINEDMPYGMIINIKHLKSLTKELFDLCVEYAKTPIEERKEEKKYYLKICGTFYVSNYAYLNFNIKYGNYMLSDGKQNHRYQTQFTQKEIDEVKEKFNTNLSEFEQIPVEED